MINSELSLSLALKVFGTLLAFSLYFLGCIIYNIYFHPLAKYPGPKLWAALRFRYVLSMWSGWHHKNVEELHRQYGDIVRLAPDELSFASASAFPDIYSNAPNRPAFPKSSTWHSNIPGRPLSAFVALDPKVHARFRKAMDPAFTEKSVRLQESIIQANVDLFVAQLSKLAAKEPGGVVVDIVQWFAFVAFDLVGDLGFGEPFGSLQASKLHPWIGLIFSTIAAATYNVSLSYYPALHWLFSLAIPKKVMRQLEEHWEFSEEKINQRLQQQSERPDMVSMIKRDDEGVKGITRPELTATAALVIVAGSETVVSVLSGILNYMVKSPDVLGELTHEVRTTFRNEGDMSLAALKELLYLAAVIQEGLRLCNPIPVGLPRITPPTGGSVAGNWIPANTYVNVHPETIYHSPAAFHRAEEFLPERWLTQDPAFADDQLGAVQTFSMGPRSCIGRPLAMAELRLILARLVWRFDLKQVDSEAGRLEWKSQRTFSVVERKPFEVRLKVREGVEVI